MRAQPGFTLPELLVVVAIVALLAGIATLGLAIRPAALMASADSFDASLTAARAIAAASGNGATLAFSPRLGPDGREIAGFVLRVYRGRPQRLGALDPSAVAPVIGDAGVTEATLGAPPLAIFINSAGNATARRGYAVTSSGKALSYDVLAQEPPCPSGGSIRLIFRDTRGNAATRTLACSETPIGMAAPVATMTPDRPRLTPPRLIFAYPSAAHAHFVATEWGYRRWYAALDGFDCGTVATFDREPQPYTPPHSPGDVSATPLVSPGLPYSFANSNESMQDAPAWFWLKPAVAGFCSARLADALGQQVNEAVQVMGALTIQPSELDFDSASSPPQIAVLSKTYDAEPIVARVLSSTCAGVAEMLIGAGTAPPQPVADPATTPATVLPRGFGACSVIFGDQFTALGEPPAVLSITVGGQPCSRIGGSCVLVLPANIEGGSCDPSGAMGGTNVFYSAAFAAGSENRGTLVDDGNATWTFTRTAPGPVRIDEIVTTSTLIPRPGVGNGTGCTAIVHHRIARSWTF